jgi:hypothetical protein
MNFIVMLHRGIMRKQSNYVGPHDDIYTWLMLGWERPHKTLEPIATREWRCLRQNVVKYLVRPPVSCDQLLAGSEAESARASLGYWTGTVTLAVMGRSRRTWVDKAKGKVGLLFNYAQGHRIGGIAPCILNLNTMEVSGHLHATAALLPVSILQKGVWRRRRRAKSTIPARDRTPIPRLSSQ